MAEKVGKSDISTGDIIGSWRLESWLIHYENGREPNAPFGKNPRGQLLYNADGWMSATVHRPDRNPLPADQSPRELDSDLLAGAFRSYFHYAGPWRIEGNCVIHSVQHSLNPNMTGTDQVRQMILEEPFLTLAADETAGGVTRRHELIWRRTNPRE